MNSTYDLNLKTWTEDGVTRDLQPHDAHRIWVRETDRSPANAKRIVVACCGHIDPHAKDLDPADALEILQL